MLVGLPGAGKSTLAAAFSRAVPGWETVNQDALGSRATCVSAAARILAAGGRVVVILGDHDVQNLPSLWGELWPEERGAGLPAWCRVVLAVERTCARPTRVRTAAHAPTQPLTSRSRVTHTRAHAPSIRYPAQLATSERTARRVRTTARLTGPLAWLSRALRALTVRVSVRVLVVSVRERRILPARWVTRVRRQRWSPQWSRLLSLRQAVPTILCVLDTPARSLRRLRLG